MSLSRPLLVFGAILLAVMTLVPAACGSDGTSDTESTATTTTTETMAAPETLALTQEDDGGSFTIQVGGTITLALEANPSTGFTWEMIDTDPEASLIEQIGDPAFLADDPEAAGSSGTLTFMFRAVDRGEMVIDLAYYPPDPTEDPTETFEIYLTVE